MLRRAGVKLAVATANRPELFMPALERAGVDGLFDAFCTSAEVGHTSKRDGALFELAARKLGVEAAECAVFEDVPDRRMRTVREIKGTLLDHGALAAMMTGTGSAVFGVFDDARSAEAARDALGREYRFSCVATPVARYMD
jgi:4-diphosphocytidyl-2-C-methyl-D-erythritol kinase